MANKVYWKVYFEGDIHNSDMESEKCSTLKEAMKIFSNWVKEKCTICNSKCDNITIYRYCGELEDLVKTYTSKKYSQYLNEEWEKE